MDPIQANRVAWAKRARREPHPEDWAPLAPQAAFLRLSCFEALYGGAAGGGKTDAGLVFLLGGIGKGAGAAYQGLFLRRTYPELAKNAIPRARELFPRVGGVERDGGTRWIFPGGETILLEHCEHEKDITRYQGAPFTRVFFDELTTFTEYQYLYLFSRIRSTAGLWCGVRASSNPGGVGHAWVRRRFFDWVSRKSVKRVRPGEVRYFVRRNDVDHEVPRGTRGSLGRTFIPAKLDDNPFWEVNDPEYRARLEQLPRLERDQLLGGDWDAEPAKKDFWDRVRSPILRARVPNQDVLVRVRSWDFGATASNDADASAGVLICRLKNGRVVIEHGVHGRWSPDGVDAELVRWAASDSENDPRTIIVIPKDPAAAGKVAVAHYQRLLAKYALKIVTPTGSKTTRFKPCSSRQLGGFVDVVDDGTWPLEELHAECETFPDGHDDWVDAVSDGYNTVAADVNDDEELIVLP